ncbi:hypothetical protein KSP40_PGU011913 [Platanthera guangdongensis]|uniref:Uncharacterized protein n=1 Tax=Platanthera guangdongensis TaxID=2320717 RepID=A0ABR2LRD0_9ASPA
MRRIVDQANPHRHVLSKPSMQWGPICKTRIKCIKYGNMFRYVGGHDKDNSFKARLMPNSLMLPKPTVCAIRARRISSSTSGSKFKSFTSETSLISMLNCPFQDGRTWKERMSSTGAQVRTDFPVMKKVGAQNGKEVVGRRHNSAPRSRPILSSTGTPEHQIMKLLQECKTAVGRTAAN